MSGGHGRVQKALLRRLRDHETSSKTYGEKKAGTPALGLPTQTLVESVYRVRRTSWFPTKAQEHTVRRALHGLARQGLIVGPLRLDGVMTWRWNVADPLDR
jgi:hypothetical protein